MTLIGEKEMDILFKHVGEITTEDTYLEAIEEVKYFITAQTNQCMARF